HSHNGVRRAEVNSYDLAHLLISPSPKVTTTMSVCQADYLLTKNSYLGRTKMLLVSNLFAHLPFRAQPCHHGDAVPQFSFVPSAESRELTDDLRDLFADLETAMRPEQRVFSGECHPSLDVVETANAVEVIVDVSGVPPEAVRVLFRGDLLVVAG